MTMGDVIPTLSSKENAISTPTVSTRKNHGPSLDNKHTTTQQPVDNGENRYIKNDQINTFSDPTFPIPPQSRPSKLYGNTSHFRSFSEPFQQLQNEQRLEEGACSYSSALKAEEKNDSAKSSIMFMDDINVSKRRGSSSSSTRSLLITPTTETLARRMSLNFNNRFPPVFPANTRSERCRPSSSLHRTCSASNISKENEKIENINAEDNANLSSRSYQLSPKSSHSPSRRSIHSFDFDDLVSTLPSPLSMSFNDISDETPKELPLPLEGSTHENPNNYISQPAYVETEDHTLFFMNEESRRAGIPTPYISIIYNFTLRPSLAKANAGITSMFDMIFPIRTRDGMIPEGFPITGFGLREMKARQIAPILEAYDVEAVPGRGFAVDRENQALLCSTIGAAWLAAVI